MFKVGDKVKVIYNGNNSSIVKDVMGKGGTVCRITSMIYVEFDEEVWQNLTMIGFFENEIEKVVTKGQQLLFSFME